MQHLGSTETIKVPWLRVVAGGHKTSLLKAFSHYHTGLPANFRIPILVAILQGW